MRLFALMSVSIAMLAIACAPAAPAPTAAPAKAAAPAAPAKPAEAKPAPSPAVKPAASPAAKTDESLAEWERVLAAAKQEAKVSVVGAAGVEMRDVLTQPFQEKYGIPVDFLGASGREIAPRITTERQAGQYLWDIMVHGTTTGLETMIPMGAFDPLEPALVLPEVKDPKNWRGGGIEFVDDGRRMVVFTPFQRGTLFVNPNNVKPEEIKSYKDLLDPKFKGKIVIDDPRASGPGQATFTLFFLHPDLGPDFIRALARQELAVFKDYRQEADAVAQGRYLVAIGTADFTVEPLMKQGVPITIIDPRQLREGSDVSPANGAMGLINRAPHPNAARVYVNWLLSKDGQTAFARANGYVSSRVDVPTDHALPWRTPQPGAIKTYTQETMGAKETLLPLLKELFGD